MCGSIAIVNGEKFDKVFWYGISPKVNDASSYWVVDVKTLSAPSVGVRAVAFEVVPLDLKLGKTTTRQCVIPGPRSFRLMTKNLFDTSALNTILQLCKRHRGVYAWTAVCEKREQNPNLVQFCSEGCKELVCISGTLECIPPLIVNDLYCLLGYDAAIRARDEMIE